MAPSQPPSVSVVIPVFNRASALEEACQSVRDQVGVRPEVVIVDDASTSADTRETITQLTRQDPTIKAVFLARNGGPGAARNRGVQVCTGSLVTFLDSDDLMTPGRLQDQRDRLLEHPDQDAVVGLCELLVADGVEAIPEELQRLALGVGGAANYPMSMMVRRTVFDHVGGFDETFRYAEDLDLLARLMAEYRVLVVDRVYTVRRLLGDNLSYSTEAMLASRFQMLRKHRHTPREEPEQP